MLTIKILNVDNEKDVETENSEKNTQCIYNDGTEITSTDKILNIVSTSAVDVQLEEIEDETENHPEEIFEHPSTLGDKKVLECMMPEVKLFVTHTFTSEIKCTGADNENLNDTNTEKKKENYDEVEEVLSTNRLPQQAPLSSNTTKEKKKRKSKTENNTVVSKPIGLVRPLEKRRKRINYLEMHTGKLSPQNLVRTDEKEKTPIKDSESLTTIGNSLKKIEDSQETDSNNNKFITISSELKESNQLEKKNLKPQSSSESKKIKSSKPNLTQISQTLNKSRQVKNKKWPQELNDDKRDDIEHDLESMFMTDDEENEEEEDEDTFDDHTSVDEMDLPLTFMKQTLQLSVLPFLSQVYQMWRGLMIM